MERKVKKNKKKTVFVGMSGGVDSSVAAYLLKKQNHDVVGVFMRCYNLDGCAERDAEDARRVAEKLKIPFYVWDFEKEYKKKVVDYMISGYKKGITPNPDVMCNKYIKFDLFLEKALRLGADYVATGHYVRLISRRVSDGTAVSLAQPLARRLALGLARPTAVGHHARSASETFRTKHAEKIYSLVEAKDKTKDQSYFLWTLTQKQLKRCLFPIGDYLKVKEVRQIAKKAGLPTAEKPDSQGVCFIGEFKMEDFLKKYIKPKKGKIKTIGEKNLDGKILGEHQGLNFYTIGQRKGIKIGGQKGLADLPFYVAKKDFKNNILYVALGNSDKNLFQKELIADNINWISGAPFGSAQGKPKFPLKCEAKIRYRQESQKCTIFEFPISNSQFPNKSKIQNPKLIKKLKVVFNVPQRAITPGQSIVFYKNNEMIGGAVIK
ncbi:tRNA-specific 2-thiouridylase [Candidatus Wolfebacteria bacterium]|nr:tRNA-specific 2-thiouridylase [Candidatus Wolfebacteria bacterium]